MRGRLLGKLKSISRITTFEKGLRFQVSTPNQYFPNLTEINDEKDSSLVTENVPIRLLKGLELVKDDDEEMSIPLDSENYSSLLDFEEKCPPGGGNSVILYTTSLRGIRKTFEDCNTIRFLLESFRVVYYERDVSMHMEFREELWQIMGGRVIPPKLFIKGRHIGGVDEVVELHEQGKLRRLLQGIPTNLAPNRACNGCAGVRFVLCCQCDGSRKVIAEGQENELVSISCVKCNENGLVKCPICC